MVELTKEDTTKLWDDIQVYWNIIKGKEKGDSDKARKEINRIQGLLGLEVTDFEKEPKKEKPKIETPTKELEEYTVAQAEEVFSHVLDVIDKGLDKAIAFRELVADMVVKKYPKLKNNPAGIGQMVNITYDLVKDKLK